MNSCKCILLLVCFIFASHNANSQRDSVNCFIEVQDIWDLDFNRGTVMIDFYLTIEYKDDLNKELGLLNGTIQKVDTLIDLSDEGYFNVRICAEIRNNFEFKKYPLDNQTILIKLEPYEYFQDMVLVSHPLHNIFVGDIHLNGWSADKIIFEQKAANYKIFENGEVKTYSYSNANFLIPIVRKQRFFYAFKIFIPSIISILIIYIGFFLSPSNIASRLNLSVGSLFVMISNFIVTQQMLPNISTITLIEKVNILSLTIICLTIFYFAVAYRFKSRLSASLGRKINWTFLSLMTFFYVLLILTLL